MTNYETGLSSSTEYLRYSDWLVNGCDVKEMVRVMKDDQAGHVRPAFGRKYRKYRADIAMWIMQLCDAFDFHATTSHAAVAYMDKLQPGEGLSAHYKVNDFQMEAISCMLLAAKYNESEEKLPELAHLCESTKFYISNEMLLYYELRVMNRLTYRLDVRTPVHFLSCYMTYRGGLIKDDDEIYTEEECTLEQFEEARLAAREKVHELATVLASECLLNAYITEKYEASDVATAIAYYARMESTDLNSAAWTDSCVQDIGRIDEKIQEILYHFTGPRDNATWTTSKEKPHGGASPTTVALAASPDSNATAAYAAEADFPANSSEKCDDGDKENVSSHYNRLVYR